MTLRRRWLIDGLLIVVLAVALQLWQKRDVAAGAAPRFDGILADGRAVSLSAWRQAHPGRPVVLHFWAAWCPVCRAIEGSVDAVGRDWPLLTIALQSGDAKEIVNHLAGRGLHWPTVVDPDGRITSLFGLRGVPAVVIVDSAGTIRFVEFGYITEVGMRLRLWWAGHVSTD